MSFSPMDQMLQEWYPAGFKNDVIKIGGEFNYISNQSYIDDNDWMNISAYAGYRLTEKIDVLGRFDYLDSKLYDVSDGSYMILGFQYQPVENFFSSVNYRYNDFQDYSQIYVNFGIKF